MKSNPASVNTAAWILLAMMLVGGTLGQKIEWLNANTQQCPYLCEDPWTDRKPMVGEAPPIQCSGITVFASCRNHGMDDSACMITEIVVDVVIIAFVGSVFGIGYIFKSSLGLSAKKTAEPAYSTLMSGVSSPNETAQFLDSRIPALASEHAKINEAIKSAKKRYDRWWYLAQILGFWNIFIPAMSIVFQGILQVGHTKDSKETISDAIRDAEQAGKNITGIEYDTYDLKECSRSYRGAFVAALTVLTLIITTLIKLLNPNEVTGVEKEKKERNEKMLAQFETTLVGALTLGDNSGDEEK
jgi:hypothetical protein